MDILSVLLALLIGAGSGYLVLRSKFERERGVPREQLDMLSAELVSLKTDKAKLEGHIGSVEGTLKEANEALSQERVKSGELSTSLATARAELKNANEKLQNQKDELVEIQSRFTSEFKSLANDILDEKSRTFTETSRDKLTTILNPLEQRIKEFETTITDTYGKESNERIRLSEQIRQLTDLNQQITKEASNLTTALKGQSKAQGDWGELALYNILENSGLIKGTHYIVQPVLPTPDGGNQKPDVVINLPESKHLIIDSKVSLTAYVEYCKIDNVESQKSLLSDHLASIRRHIKELGGKSYQNLYQLQSVDFVLMFIPVEPAFILAARNDADLYNDAFNQNIIIVCASTLMATLRTIASIWRRENQNRNALEIARKSGDLYDKFVGFLEDLKSIGDKILASQKAYDDAFNKLSLGRGNIIRRTEELKEMGAKASKALPAALIEKASEPEEAPSLEDRNGD